MGAIRKIYEYKDLTDATPFAADDVVADLESFEIRFSGTVSVQVQISTAGGSSPSDSPAGVWRYYTSVDGTNFVEWSTGTTALDSLKPNGNNLVSGVVVLTSCPGLYGKIAYDRTSGGAGDSRVRMGIAAW